MMLDDALRECTLALLRRIAANHGIAVEPETLRGELARMIRDRLLDPGYLSGCLANLSAPELDLLRAVAEYGWTGKAFVLDRRFPRHAAGAAPVQAGDAPAVSLLQKGLLFRAFAPIGDWRGEVYYVPEELWPTVSAAFPPRTANERPDLRAGTVPDIAVENDPAFDLFCLLSLLQRTELRLSHGSPARSDLAKLEQESYPSARGPARERWEERWRFLLHLSMTCGWVVRQGAALRSARHAARALASSREAVRDRLLERYLKDWSWNDLAAIGKVRQPLGGRRIDETAARRMLLHYLEELAAFEWTDLDAFCDTLRSANPDFLREDYSSLEWAVVDTATDVEVYGPNSWDLVEREWVRHVLSGPLAWLGVVRWGRTREGRTVGFQFVGLTNPRSAEPALKPPRSENRSRVSIGGDLKVLAPAGADLELVYRLEPYLELLRRDGVGLYRLSMASVLNGMERGGSLDELRELLARPSVEPPPPAVLSQIEQWAAAYGRLVISPAILLAAANPEDADSLEASPAIGACLRTRLGPASFLVAPERLGELLRQLKLAGIYPRVDPGTRIGVARAATTDLPLLRECLFALMLVRSLHGELGMEGGGAAIHRLEAILGPEESKEVSRRVQEAVRRAR